MSLEKKLNFLRNTSRKAKIEAQRKRFLENLLGASREEKLNFFQKEKIYTKREIERTKTLIFEKRARLKQLKEKLKKLENIENIDDWIEEEIERIKAFELQKEFLGLRDQKEFIEKKIRRRRKKNIKYK